MLIVLLALAMFQDSPRPRHSLFVVDRMKVTGNVDSYANHAQGRETDNHTRPGIAARFSKGCNSVTLSEDRSKAEFILDSRESEATLTDAKGSLLYTSHAKTQRNMLKDVCTYIVSR